ncbi:unnamed protein product [Pleuronectes platessa]|uniref:Secreted protein n=1 Tax=Pleuronectes platessa TaxID=8262 RepID=A0A9N7V1K1_PLEPL|nr:unnamed protein product [Pleuronectes platessa]
MDRASRAGLFLMNLWILTVKSMFHFPSTESLRAQGEPLLKSRFWRWQQEEEEEGGGIALLFIIRGASLRSRIQQGIGLKEWLYVGKTLFTVP